jgi:ADP-L-glycero-D-manno-heptose 6-epimerase
MENTMIIVTGGAGFIGSNLVAGLEEQGLTDIVIVDTFGNGDKWRNVSKREVRDIIRPEYMFDFLEQHKGEIDTVFHIGAISSTTEMDADLIIANNVHTSRQLWRWCAQNGARFIYASSYATYGDGSAGFSDDDSPEGLARLRPLNPYGWSKHMFDRRIARIRMNGAEPIPPQWAGLKFFNVYGPNEYHKDEQMSVVCKLYPQISVGAGARLFKSNHPQYRDGGQMRDFIYVRDLVDVMVWLYQNPKVSGLYNLGTGKARSFNDLAAAMFAAVGKPLKVNYIDMPQSLVDRYQNFTQAEMGKLQAAGYTKSFTGLEEGVADYVQTYLSQPDKYR